MFVAYIYSNPTIPILMKILDILFLEISVKFGELFEPHHVNCLYRSNMNTNLGLQSKVHRRQFLLELQRHRKIEINTPIIPIVGFLISSWAM